MMIFRNFLFCSLLYIITCRCHYKGVIYNFGDTWVIDRCNKCTCNSDGTFSCETNNCTANIPRCRYYGQLYTVGDVYKAVDGCTRCICTEGGHTVCSKMFCPLSTFQPPPPPTATTTTSTTTSTAPIISTSFSTTTAAKQTSISPSMLINHKLNENGANLFKGRFLLEKLETTVTTTRTSPSTTTIFVNTTSTLATTITPPAITTRTSPSPTTISANTTSTSIGTTKCTFYGRVHSLGSNFLHSDGCNNCTCESNNVVTCTAMTCVPTPTCIYNGTEQHFGYPFPANDGCNTCHCVGREDVDCTLNLCPPTTSHLPQISTQRSSKTCSYNEEVYMIGDTFRSNDGCRTCQCVDIGLKHGLVGCTKMICPLSTAMESSIAINTAATTTSTSPRNTTTSVTTTTP